MSISPKQSARRLGDVVPQAFEGLQANHCCNPSCQNFHVPPRRLDPDAANPRGDKLGAYALFSAGETVLRCGACGRMTALISNSSLATELHRLRMANGILVADSCPVETCANHSRVVHEHPTEYFAHGRAGSGAERKRCKRCKTTFSLSHHYRSPRAGHINHDIVKDLVNRSAVNAIVRKLGVTFTTIYDRIDFIHEQMVAFEAFKLKALRKPGWKRKRYALAIDAQDHMVNWSSRDRRIGIQLSTISTADNFTGFIFRTDVSFDPTIGDVVKHFDQLVRAGDFSTVEGLGLSHRYVLPSFFRAVGRGLRKGEIKGMTEARREELLSELETLYPEFDRDEDLAADIPTTGALIKKGYTAAAHCRMIAEMLPSDAQLHIMTDADGAFVSAIPIGFAVPFKEQRADLTFVGFNKDLTNPKKKALVAKYKKKLEQFIATDCDPSDDASAIRRAFIDRYASNIGRVTTAVAADWWAIPIATMYEPEKRVAVAHQRVIGTEEEMHDRHLELLDRSSLHAVDSFFNVMRQRVSYFHRAGLSRSSGSFYNAFQPYRPDMVQKIVDIARIYFNWVEPRPFRLSRKFKGLLPTEFDSSHEELETVHDETERQTRREQFSTPAMRMFLAETPVRLDTILNTDWRKRLKGLPASAPRPRRRPKRASATIGKRQTTGEAVGAVSIV